MVPYKVKCQRSRKSGSKASSKLGGACEHDFMKAFLAYLPSPNPKLP